MARPNKQGVDYFPLDVHMDDKLKFIEIKFKLEGFAIVIKLFQRIYAQGYWCKWTEDEMLLFSDEIKADFEKVGKITDECLKRDIFDKEMYEKHKILTSKGIQKRYKEIVRRRKGVELVHDYLLIDGNFGVNDGTTGVNDDINPSESRHDDGKSTQSKVNKTKLNKTNNNNYPEKNPNVQKFSISDMENARYLFELMQKNNPGAKQPDFDKWADTFRLMRERDERTDEQIKYLISWSQQDEFWHTNILSPATLLKHWDKLVLKAKKDHQAAQQLQTVNGPVDLGRLEAMLEDE